MAMTADERAIATRRAFLSGSVNGPLEARLKELAEEAKAINDDDIDGTAAASPARSERVADTLSEG